MIIDKGIKIGLNLKYEHSENLGIYTVLVEDEELDLPAEMANNIFIRV